jgi:hypothetical protein
MVSGSTVNDPLNKLGIVSRGWWTKRSGVTCIICRDCGFLGLEESFDLWKFFRSELKRLIKDLNRLDVGVGWFNSCLICSNLLSSIPRLNIPSMKSVTNRKPNQIETSLHCMCCSITVGAVKSFLGSLHCWRVGHPVSREILSLWSRAWSFDIHGVNLFSNLVLNQSSLFFFLT